MKESKFYEVAQPVFTGEQIFAYTCYGLAILLLVIAIFNRKLLLQIIDTTITVAKTTVITVLVVSFIFSVLGIIINIISNF